jgi:hypothetical protein
MISRKAQTVWLAGGLLTALVAQGSVASAQSCSKSSNVWTETINTQVPCGLDLLATSVGTNTGLSTATVNVNLQTGDFATVSTRTQGGVSVPGCSAADVNPEGIADTDTTGCSTARQRTVTVFPL